MHNTAWLLYKALQMVLAKNSMIVDRCILHQQGSATVDIKKHLTKTLLRRLAEDECSMTAHVKPPGCRQRCHACRLNPIPALHLEGGKGSALHAAAAAAIGRLSSALAYPTVLYAHAQLVNPIFL